MQRIGDEHGVGRHQHHHARLDAGAVVREDRLDRRQVTGRDGFPKREVLGQDLCRLRQTLPVLIQQAKQHPLSDLQLLGADLAPDPAAHLVDEQQHSHLHECEQQHEHERQPRAETANLDRIPFHLGRLLPRGSWAGCPALAP